jgi:hypothetical protein
MAETSKPKAMKVGSPVDVKDRAKVLRPDGVEVTVTGGTYVLSQSGDYVVDGSVITAK